MSDTIQLRPRKTRPGQAPDDPPVLVPDTDPEAEPQLEPEPEPDPEPAADAKVSDLYARLDGTRIQAAVARFLKRGIRWLLYQVFVLPPRRAWRCIRWFRNGVTGNRDPETGEWIGGVVGLVQWCYAADERRDAKRAAKESPGGLVRATRMAGQMAILRTSVLIIAHVVSVVALDVLTPVPWWLAFAPIVIVAIVHGNRIDPKPPALPVAVPHQKGDITRDMLNDALRAVGTLPKPTNGEPPRGITFAALPKPAGIGRRLIIDLPASVKAAYGDVIKERSRIAASLALPESQFYLEPGKHAGQVVIWHSEEDPFAGGLREHPLYDANQWDVWEPAPFGHEPWGTPVKQCLVFSAMITASRPRRGKTFSARSAVLPGVLDPYVRFLCWNLKGDEAWDALKPVCEFSGGVFDKGRTDAKLEALAATLERLCVESDERNSRIHGSKLTRAQARDLQVNAPVTFVIIDEVQRALASTFGDRIASALIDLAKNAPSSGYILILATQKTGSDEFPTTLRAVFPTRFALHMMTWRDSDQVLGDSMAADGYNAKDLPLHKGVGILRPDDDADDDGVADDDPRPAKTVRVYDTGDEMWEHVCAHGLALRQNLNGSAAHGVDDDRPRGLLALVVDVLREHGDLPASGLLQHLPEPWSQLGADHLGTELRALGLRSVKTHKGRRYQLEEASRTLSRTRHDPVAPRRGMDGVATGRATGQRTGNEERAMHVTGEGN